MGWTSKELFQSWQGQKISVSYNIPRPTLGPDHPPVVTRGFAAEVKFRLYIVWNSRMIRWKFKRSGRKHSWCNLRHSTAMCLEGLRRTMKILNHSAGLDFNSWLPSSIVGALFIQIHLILPLNLYNDHHLHITHTIFFVHGM